jgi:hypothetical protein
MSGFSPGDHNYFFHFNDEHGLEAYFPPDGTYLSFHVDPSLGKSRIRVVPTSLSFDAYSSASLSGDKRGKTFKDHMTIEVDFAGLITENRGGSTYVTSSGCIESTETGRPMLPITSFLTLLPPSSTLQSITMTSIDQVKLPGEYNVACVGQLAKTGSDLSVSGKVSGLFSTESCVAGEVGGFKGYRVVGVAAFAARYLSDSKVLIQNNAITITLEFDTSKDKSIESMFRGIIEDNNEIAGIVANPDATSMYPLKSGESTATYQYVIITTDDMSSAFQPLVDWKTQKLGSATVVTVSTIQSQYSGADTQEKIRNFIKYAYQNWQTQWVLLGGDVEAVPQRGAYGLVGSTEDKSIPCDLYYSDLDGTWDADGDHIYGETTDGVNLYPDVYVGRAPVNTAAEATNFVNKVLTYEQAPPLGYLTKALLITYWLDSGTNEASLKDYIASNYLSGSTITKYYESSAGAGVDKNGVINSINSGQGIVNQASHGNEWQVPPFDISDVDNLQNGQKYFVFYSTACYTNAFDISDCIAEHFLLNTHGGAVAYVGNSRYGWYYIGMPGSGPGDQYDKEFFNCLSQGYKHIGETLAKSKVTFISQSESDGAFRWTMYCLNLLGDPEMTIHTEEFGKSVKAYNDGNAVLAVSDITARYQAGEPTGWLEANPKSFAVPVGTTPQEVTVTANSAGLSPNTYHAWLQIWSNDGYGNDPCEVPVTFTVHPLCNVHLESRQDTGSSSHVGTITFDGQQYNLPNDVAKLPSTYQAIYTPPPPYYDFYHWEVSGSIAVSDPNANPTAVTVSGGGGTLTAIYTQYAPVHLESRENNWATSNAGTITFDGQQYSLPNDILKPIIAYQATYNPPSNYAFDRWETTDGITVSNPDTQTTTVYVNNNAGGTLRAVYKAVLYGLLVEVRGSGTTNATGTAMYNAGTSVAVNATPLSGWTLNNWLLNGSDVGSANPYVVMMDQNRNLTAVFVQLQYLVVRGNDNRIYYRSYNFSSGSWDNWNPLLGLTCDSPAATVCGGELHVVVRGINFDQIWHSYINLTDKAFSGWTLLSGSTPSAPTLTANSTTLCLVVRGETNIVYYRFYDVALKVWSDWTAVPDGTTNSSPAATLLKDTLQIVVRGINFDQIWHSYINLTDKAFSGWTLLSGSTPSAPTLTANSTTLCLVVRGETNIVYYRFYDVASRIWTGWTPFPAYANTDNYPASGATIDSPAATLLDGALQVVVRGINGDEIWYGHVNLADGTFSGWIQLSGSTRNKPTLTG